MKRLVAILCCLVIMAVSVPFSVSAECEDMAFNGRIFMLDNSPFGSDEDFFYSPTHILNSKTEAKEFHHGLFNGEAEYLDADFAKYINNLSDDFFIDNTLLVVCTETGNPGLDLISLDLDKDGNVLTVDMDFSEMNPQWGYPDMIQPILVVLEIRRGVLENVDSIKAEREYIPYSLYLDSEGQVIPMDYFPANYDGDIYVTPGPFVINTPEKLDEFLAIDFEDRYSGPSVREYLSNIDEAIFEENSIIIGILEMPTAGHDFNEVKLSKKNGTLTIESLYTRKLGVEWPDVCGYYAAIAVIKNDLLWDITQVVTTVTDVTEYPQLDYVFESFKGDFVDGDYGNEPIIVTDSDSLNQMLEDCDSSDFKRYGNFLKEDFFDSKALIVIQRDFDYSNIRYTAIGIADRTSGDGENWTIVIQGDQFKRVKGEMSRIFVFEIDKAYADKNFYVNVRRVNIRGDVNRNGIVDSLDYVVLKRYYFGSFTFSDDQLRLGDLNGNGVIDSMDYVLLKRAYFGTYEI